MWCLGWIEKNSVKKHVKYGGKYGYFSCDRYAE